MAGTSRATSPAGIPDNQSEGFTEAVGLTLRWGRYITGIEQRALNEALRMFSTPSDALEVGCEAGRWSKMLADKGWRVTCSDVDEAMLRSCQARIPTAKCILVKPEDRTIPCATRSADLILCIEVFPVMHDDWFSAEVQRVLRPEGVLMGVFLNRRSLRGLTVRLRESFGKGHSDAAYGACLYSRSYAPWKRQLQSFGLHFVFERGICWFPFGRSSDSILISACTAAERALGLQRLVGLSPWIVFVARKDARHCNSTDRR